jgi:hypothetical protein
MSTNTDNGREVKSHSEFSVLGDAISRFLALKPASPDGVGVESVSPDAPTPSATRSEQPAVSPPPRIVSASPERHFSDDSLSHEELLRRAAEADRIERARRKELLRGFCPGTNRSYVPLTDHPKFQRGVVEKEEQDREVNKVFSCVSQNPVPDPFFLTKPSAEKIWQPCPPLPGPSGFGLWVGWKPIHRGTIPGSVRRFGARIITPRDASAAVKRRRWLSNDLGMPKKFAEQYTTTELAEWCVAARDVAQNGKFDRSTKEHADMAGGRYTSAANWRRKARRLGHIIVKWRDAAGNLYDTWEKSLNGTKSMTCIITFCDELMQWVSGAKNALKNLGPLKTEDRFFLRPAPP